MSFFDEHRAISQAFVGAWADRTPVELENTDRSVSRDAQGLPDEYVVMTIMNGRTAQIEFGKVLNNYRHFGDVNIQVMGLKDKGTGVVLNLADQVAGIFRSLQIYQPKIVFDSPVINRVGRISEYYQLNVITSYYRDSTF